MSTGRRLTGMYARERVNMVKTVRKDGKGEKVTFSGKALDSDDDDDGCTVVYGSRVEQFVEQMQRKRYADEDRLTSEYLESEKREMDRFVGYCEKEKFIENVLETFSKGWLKK